MALDHSKASHPIIMDEVEKLATGHLRTFSRLDSAEWTARLGIETSGYVK